MSRGRMTYIKLYFEEFKAGCEDLSNEEIGAYWRVLMEIYSAMGPIPFDDRRLARRLNCRPHKARALVENLIEKRKLFLNPAGQISNHRAEREIAEYVRISVQNQLNARSPRNTSVSRPEKVNKINETAQRPLSDRSAILESRTDNLLRSAVGKSKQPPAAAPKQTTMMLPLPGGKEDGPRTSEQSLADMRARQARRSR